MGAGGGVEVAEEGVKEEKVRMKRRRRGRTAMVAVQGETDTEEGGEREKVRMNALARQKKKMVAIQSGNGISES